MRSGQTPPAPERPAEITCAVHVGYSKPAHARPAYAAPKFVLGFIVSATRRAAFEEGRSNAKAHTWKKQFGSFSHWAGLHGTELRLRARRGQEGRDLPDSGGSRTRRHILRHRRSLRPVHERRTRR